MANTPDAVGVTRAEHRRSHSKEWEDRATDEAHTIVGPGGHAALTTSSSQALCPGKARSPGAQRWQASRAMKPVLSQGWNLLVLLQWLLGGARPRGRTRVAPCGETFCCCGLLWRRGAGCRGGGVSAGPKGAGTPDRGVASQG